METTNKQSFTHAELNDYLEDRAYHAEAISYPEVARQLRAAKSTWSILEKIDWLVNEEEYELWDDDGKKYIC